MVLGVKLLKCFRQQLLFVGCENHIWLVKNLLQLSPKVFFEIPHSATVIGSGRS